MPLLLKATSLKKKTKKKQIAEHNLLAKSLNKPATMAKGLLPNKNAPVATPEQTQSGQLTSLPALPPGQGNSLPTKPKTNMMDYWKQPVFGKMPLDQFSGMSGSLAHAIAPDTAQGRVGKIFGDRGNQMYNLRLGRELKAEDLGEQRGYLKDMLDERREYTERIAGKAWDRGTDRIEATREYNAPYRKAQIEKMAKEPIGAQPSRWTTVYNDLRKQINPDTKKLYTTPEILKVWKAKGSERGVDTGAIKTQKQQVALNKQVIDFVEEKRLRSEFGYEVTEKDYAETRARLIGARVVEGRNETFKFFKNGKLVDGYGNPIENAETTGSNTEKNTGKRTLADIYNSK